MEEVNRQWIRKTSSNLNRKRKAARILPHLFSSHLSTLAFSRAKCTFIHSRAYFNQVSVRYVVRSEHIFRLSSYEDRWNSPTNY